jgi:hypothetical protein
MQHVRPAFYRLPLMQYSKAIVPDSIFEKPVDLEERDELRE